MSSARQWLLNDLVRPPQHRLWDRQSERLGSLEVDHELELRRLLYGQTPDPFVPKLPSMRHYSVSAEPGALDSKTLEESDFVIIVTHHDGIDWDFVVEHAPLVIDTRDATQGVRQGREKIVRA